MYTRSVVVVEVVIVVVVVVVVSTSTTLLALRSLLLLPLLLLLLLSLISNAMVMLVGLGRLHKSFLRHLRGQPWYEEVWNKTLEIGKAAVMLGR